MEYFYYCKTLKLNLNAKIKIIGNVALGVFRKNSPQMQSSFRLALSDDFCCLFLSSPVVQKGFCLFPSVSIDSPSRWNWRLSGSVGEEWLPVWSSSLATDSVAGTEHFTSLVPCTSIHIQQATFNPCVPKELFCHNITAVNSLLALLFLWHLSCRQKSWDQITELSLTGEASVSLSLVIRHAFVKTDSWFCGKEN